MESMSDSLYKSAVRAPEERAAGPEEYTKLETAGAMATQTLAVRSKPRARLK